MQYPVEILPKNGLTIISDFDNRYLIRHTPNKEIWDIDGQIKETMICSPKTNMMDLSTSLVGVFGDPHYKLNIVNPFFIEACPPDFNASVPVYKNDFLFTDERGYFIIDIFSLNGIKVSIEKDTDIINAVCMIQHSPVKWNYYHFSINWYFPDYKIFWHQMDESDTKKKWSKERLSSRTRSELKMKVKNIKLDEIL